MKAGLDREVTAPHERFWCAWATKALVIEWWHLETHRKGSGTRHDIERTLPSIEVISAFAKACSKPSQHTLEKQYFSTHLLMVMPHLRSLRRRHEQPSWLPTSLEAERANQKLRIILIVVKQSSPSPRSEADDSLRRPFLHDTCTSGYQSSKLLVFSASTPYLLICKQDCIETRCHVFETKTSCQSYSITA